MNRYEFGYGDQTAYARVASLLSSRVQSDGVVLDIGCGYGALAEICRDRGFTYVGVDVDAGGVKDLIGRGFEAHELVVEASEAFDLSLREILGDRSVAAILMLDVIEHVADPVGVLEALRSISLSHDAAPLILCLPNVTHYDVGAKLLMGRWDQTRVGILDDTHVHFFSAELLDRTTRAAGWHEVEALDFTLEESDQHFPRDSVALTSGTPLHSVLKAVRNGHSPGGDVVQFVRTFVPGPVGSSPVSLTDTSEPDANPLLTVLTRTQGDRLETLQETLLCLAGQSCTDFEVLILAHNVTPLQAENLGYLVSSLSPAVSGKFRIVPVTGPGRCRPLNVGTSEARGRYIAVLDDDDLVMGNWVEVFRDLAAQWPGRVLRATVAEQDITRGGWPDRLGYHITSGIRTPYPDSFDLFDHLVENHSPPCGLAFPASCFRDLGITFDETLPVLEDWDVLLQCVLVSGIATSSEVTSIYRRWQTGASSTSIHSPAEWSGAHQAVIAKLDRQASIMPVGSISRVRQLQAAVTQSASEVRQKEQEIHELREQLNRDVGDREQLRTDIRNLSASVIETADRVRDEFRASHSWRVTKPLRVGGRILRKARGGSQ